MRLLMLFTIAAVFSCASNNPQNSDVFNVMCYNNKLYYYFWDDPEQILIPYKNLNNESINCKGY